MISDDKAMELINRRRRQMHVHSIIYYYLHTSLIDDATFDAWAVELASLQKDFPKLKHKGYMPSLFEDWTGDTGMHLPVTEQALWLAESLVAHSNNGNGIIESLAKTDGTAPDSVGQKPVRWTDVGYE